RFHNNNYVGFYKIALSLLLCLEINCLPQHNSLLCQRKGSISIKELEHNQTAFACTLPGAGQHRISKKENNCNR
ncbi:MAG: hypothetical protein KAJ25_08010, partial [Desulfobacula sp.]|nr:hypothetical protein [Desulfobacula sp.]